MTDEELYLIYLIQSGDKVTFKNVFHKYKLVLYMHAFRTLENEHAAKAAVRAVFKAWWLDRQKAPIRGSIKAYLYNAIIADCRKRQERPDTTGGKPVHIESHKLLYQSGACIYPLGWNEFILLGLIRLRLLILAQW